MTSTSKVCSIYMEMVSPEKLGIALSKWVVWCEDHSESTYEHQATVVAGVRQAENVFQSLVDTHKALGYCVIFNNKEI